MAKHSGSKSCFYTAVSIIFLVLCGCKNPMGLTIRQTVEVFSKPAYTVSPGDENGISRTTNIKIVFSESMDTGSFQISGIMAREGCNMVWSATKASDDTLTISPQNRWSAGSDKTLVINGKDQDGYAIEAIALAYGILDGIVYVHNGKGKDSFPGTPDKPKQTIQAAVDLAARYYDEAEVHVAEGEYRIISPIFIDSSISLYGGFSYNDWGIRETNPKWAISGKKESTFPTRLISFYKSIEEETIRNTVLNILNYSKSVIDGFYIEGCFGKQSCGIFIYGALPIIQSNKINGGYGDEKSYGIFVSYSNVIIENNNIIGREAGDTLDSGIIYSIVILDSNNFSIRNNIINAGVGYGLTAIYPCNSSGIIMNNEILGGYNPVPFQSRCIVNEKSICIIRNNTINFNDPSVTYNEIAIGIENINSSPTIQNNTFFGGDSHIVCAIENSISSTPIIQNNIIIIHDGDITIGISQIDDSSTPVSINNNNIFGVNPPYLCVYSKDEYNENELNSLPFASGNISLDPAFADKKGGDFHLTSASPVEVRQGGLDLSAQFTEDKDGSRRTAVLTGSPSNEGAAGWSMGAYECDEN